MDPRLQRRICLTCGGITEFPRIPGSVTLRNALCSHCGSRATSNVVKEMLYCPRCKSDDFAISVTVPRAHRMVGRLTCGACNFQKTTEEVMGVIATLNALIEFIFAEEKIIAFAQRQRRARRS